eukprot:COSAG04_NODE_12344_length_657_cov_1.268817_1_plen_154_part_10
MRAVFRGQHIRMRTNKGFVHPPLPQDDQSVPRDGELPLADVVEVGALHADGPFIAGAPVRVAAPYPDTTMQMQTVWMLSDFTEQNGGTRVATGTHLYPTNPTSKNTFGAERDVVSDLVELGHDVRAKHRIEQATGKAGSVLLFDNRLWHGGGNN